MYRIMPIVLGVALNLLFITQGIAGEIHQFKVTMQQGLTLHTSRDLADARKIEYVAQLGGTDAVPPQRHQTLPADMTQWLIVGLTDEGEQASRQIMRDPSFDPGEGYRGVQETPGLARYFRPQQVFKLILPSTVSRVIFYQLSIEGESSDLLELAAIDLDAAQPRRFMTASAAPVADSESQVEPLQIEHLDGAAPSVHTFDIVFLGLGYDQSQTEEYEAAVQRMISRIVSLEPFSTHRDLFKFHRIASARDDNIIVERETLPIAAEGSGEYDPSEIDSWTRIIAITGDAPYLNVFETSNYWYTQFLKKGSSYFTPGGIDTIVMIYNDEGREWLGASAGVAYDPDLNNEAEHPDYRQYFRYAYVNASYVEGAGIHELGHLFALADEYWSVDLLDRDWLTSEAALVQNRCTSQANRYLGYLHKINPDLMNGQQAQQYGRLSESERISLGFDVDHLMRSPNVAFFPAEALLANETTSTASPLVDTAALAHIPWRGWLSESGFVPVHDSDYVSNLFTAQRSGTISPAESTRRFNHEVGLFNGGSRSCEMGTVVRPTYTSIMNDFRVAYYAESVPNHPDIPVPAIGNATRFFDGETLHERTAAGTGDTESNPVRAVFGPVNSEQISYYALQSANVVEGLEPKVVYLTDPQPIRLITAHDRFRSIQWSVDGVEQDAGIASLQFDPGQLPIGTHSIAVSALPESPHVRHRTLSTRSHTETIQVSCAPAPSAVRAFAQQNNLSIWFDPVESASAYTVTIEGFQSDGTVIYRKTEMMTDNWKVFQTVGSFSRVQISVAALFSYPRFDCIVGDSRVAAIQF